MKSRGMMKTRRSRVRSKDVFLTGMAMGLLLLSGTAGAAPAVPQPGAGIPVPSQDGKAPLTDNLSDKTGKAGVEAHFTLTAIKVEHPELKLNEAKLQSLTAPIIGKEITGAELQKVMDSLTKYARAKGYPAATAYIPAQTAVEGRLTVQIAPGRFGKIRLENESSLHDNVARGILAGLKEGDIIKGRKLESALKNLQSLSGIDAYGILSPGSTEGESDLTVKIGKGRSQHFVLYSENYGSKAAGRYRYGLQGEWGNFDSHGSKLNIGGLVSNARQHGYNFGAEFNVGHSATKLGIAYSRSDYELGAGMQAVGAEGIAHTYSLFGRTPLINTMANSLLLTYGYDYRDITDELKRFGLSRKKHSHVFHLGLDGSYRQGQTRLHYNATLYRGNLVPDSNDAATLGGMGGTTGHFTKGTFDVTAVQGLGKNFDVLGKISAQKAGNNLDSSEHIYLGGARGVRAYPQGEASGDEGILGTVELRYHTPVKGLVLSTYFDAGTVKWEKSRSGSATLKGWGIGLTYTKPDDWFARFDYARRIGFEENLSNDARSKQRMWFLVGKIF